MNFGRDVVDAAPPARRALVELTRDGQRREWSFGEVADCAARLAGTLQNRGVHRGDVVLTLIGNRPEWVLAMVACFRIGAVALPCNEQLRAKDLRQRLDAARPKLIVADERNAPELTAAGPDCPVLLIPDELLFGSRPAPAPALGATDPALITFTSGTTGEAKGVVHGQRYLPGQRLQAEHWLDARPDAWCGARRPADGPSRPVTCSSPRGWAERRPCSTTLGSTPKSDWRFWPPNRSTCCAWRPRKGG